MNSDQPHANEWDQGQSGDMGQQNAACCHYCCVKPVGWGLLDAAGSAAPLIMVHCRGGG